jgi:CubicO group peptidase (beta-lactamase class C family)
MPADDAAMTSRTGSALVKGFTAPGYEVVAVAFERNFADQLEAGAAFAAYVDGKPVVDLWGGVADRDRGVAWRQETLVPIFSGSKGLVAICLLLLLERGWLDLSAPVCRYWPEFAARGKERILVRDVVSHRAGLPGLTTPVSVEEATDDVRMARLLAAQAPIAAPDVGPRYHALTFGWLCGELVRRADGRSVGRFLREEIAEPLGLDVWIGLPERHESRVAMIEQRDRPTDETLVVGPEVDPVAWSIWSNPPRFSADGLAANLRVWRAAEVPASNAVANARSLARLYGCLACGGEVGGMRLVGSATIEEGRRCLSRGEDPFLGEIAFATGFQVQTAEMALGPEPDAYGHSGAGGSIHGAWPGLRTGFSYTPNLLADIGATDGRSARILTALHAAIGERESAGQEAPA